MDCGREPACIKSTPPAPATQTLMLETHLSVDICVNLYKGPNGNEGLKKLKIISVTSVCYWPMRK